jgi:hypothetical protein
MKKIFTLLFATLLFGAAAFAQKRYHNDKGFNNSYQYPSNNGYGGYGDSYQYPSNNGGYNNYWKDDDDHGYRDHPNRFQERDWDGDRFMNDKENVIGRSRFYNDNYDRYRFRKGQRFSLQLFFGERHRF